MNNKKIFSKQVFSDDGDYTIRQSSNEKVSMQTIINQVKENRQYSIYEVERSDQSSERLTEEGRPSSYI